MLEYIVIVIAIIIAVVMLFCAILIMGISLGSKSAINYMTICADNDRCPICLSKVHLDTELKQQRDERLRDIMPSW